MSARAKRRHALWSGVAMLLCSPGLAAQDARITTDVDTTLVTVGDQIRLTVNVDHVPGARVVWPDSIDVAPFEVLAAQVVPPSTTQERVSSGIVLTLAAFELGELEIPSIDVSVEGPGDEVQALSTNRFGIEVTSVGQDESGDIRGIRGPLSIPVGVITISLWLLVAVVLGALAWWLLRRLRSRPETQEEAPAVPPRPAHEVALEALDHIEASDLLVRGEVKRYHIEISEVLRRYVEARFGVPSLEMTTREVMNGLRATEAGASFREGLSRFLDNCDLVKFAKVRPDAEASRLALELGRELVRMESMAPDVEDAPEALIGNEAEAST